MTQPTEQEKHRQRLRSKALAYLARREHSELELQQKLLAYLPQAEGNEVIALDAHHQMVDAVIADFKQRGWLSEQRFTEQMIHARQQKFGSMRIAHELREKGIAEDIVEAALAQVKTSEFANALSVWKKKYDALPQNRDDWAKQARFLQSRGFGFDVIKQVLKQNTEE